MQAKVMETWRVRYPLVASSCDLVKIQESFDGNEKISRTICTPNRVAGVVANRFLSSLFDYPDNREIMEEIVALKWALISSDNASDPSLQAFRDDMREYQVFLADFITTQYTNLQKRKETSNMNNSLVKGKFLGLEIAFLFAEQEKVIIDYILGSDAEVTAYRFASWECYDGTREDHSDVSSCKLSSTWMEYAQTFCQNRCSATSGKCGVNNYALSNECTYN